ncbi:MAG: hypothetical protein ACE5ED_03605 [Rhodothalassiaceae bacterium]
MVARKSILGPTPKHPELDRLLEEARRKPATEDMLQEQRISFAFGNAPENSKITKESIREASTRYRPPVI